jgi:predicted PurR-regulated permease PerM
MSTTRYIGIGVMAVILLYIAYYFSDVITWVSLAWIVSMLGSPIMTLLGKVKIGKFRLSASLRAFIVLMLFFGVLASFVALIVPVVVQQGRNLAGVNYAKIMENLDEPFAHFSDRLIKYGIMEGELSKYHKSADTSSAPKPPKIDTTTTKDTVAIDSPKTLPSNVSTTQPNTNFVTGDTINIVVNANDTGFLYTKANIPIDSLLYYDTLSETPKVRDVQFNVRVAMQGLPKPADLQLIEAAHDTTAIEKPTDSPLEKMKKRVFSFINPSAVISGTAGFLFNFLGNFLILLTSVSFIAFFFLKDEELFARGIKGAIPDAYADRIDAALVEIKRLLTRYFGGMLFQVFMIALYVSILFAVLGIKNGILIGVFAAFLNIIPYLGPIIGALFAILVTISSNLELDFYTEIVPLIVKVCIVFASMQLLDNFLLQPIIFSNSIMAHPLEIFIVVIAGAKLGGITGMVVALPIYTVFRVIAASFLSEFKIVQQLTQHLKDPAEKLPDETTPTHMQ